MIPYRRPETKSVVVRGEIAGQGRSTSGSEGKEEGQTVSNFLEQIRADARLMRQANLSPRVVHRVVSALAINAIGIDHLDTTRAVLTLKWAGTRTPEDVVLIARALEVVSRRPLLRQILGSEEG